MDHLPRDSFYIQAVLLDEEHVEMILSSKQHEEHEEPAPPMSSYTPEVERLDMLIDAVHALISATYSAAGVPSQKVPRVKPRRRPETATQIVQHRQRTRNHDRIVALFGAKSD